MEESNQLQREVIAKEWNKDESVLVKLKQYGDAIRHFLSKMSDNPMEFLAFFDSIEKLFSELKVPKELEVNLLKPYLSERALVLVNRLAGADASDYEYVKKYLIDQFRSSQYFFEKFNRI